MLKGNGIVAQSGGPTAVINNSVCGVVQKWLSTNAPGKIYGAIQGIKGVLDENLIDLSMQDPYVLEGLKYTPGAGIFSCRYKVTPQDQQRLIAIFKKYDIRYFFYNGGNDSMDTAHKLLLAAEEAGYEMRVIGVPKTVDNDLPFTDHCPGFGSAAKYLAATVIETGIDLQSVSTKNKVTILEAMGRNAGWLTGACALAKRAPDDAPHLIYLPEVPFSIERFMVDVKQVYDRLGYCYVVASEGIVDDKGEYIAAGGVKDDFGHSQLSGVGEVLKNMIESQLGIKARCNTLGTAQRSAMHFASLTDANEAYLTGEKAVELALQGKSGVMVSLERGQGSAYTCTTGQVPLGQVANIEKKIPLEWINPQGNYVTQEFLDYVRPLIQGQVKVPMRDGLPDYVTIDQALGKLT